GFGMRIYYRFRDIFHPVVVFAAFCAMMYVLLPAYVLLTQTDEVYRFLSEERILVTLGVM
ncbi:MAG: hypothetical protein NZM42_15250, partial [Gemmatales bacterium]|nr:hypothetical protein [Gemmatales bacterium]